MPRASLVCVVWGPIYQRYARDLETSAREWLRDGLELVTLAGEGGWPNASSSRYRIVLEQLDKVRGEWIFLVDADMRFEAEVGAEILADGVTVTSHPGYPRLSDPATWPYERRPESAACVPTGAEADQYYPGAFIGGSRPAFLELAAGVAALTANDASRGIGAVWYDESYLNRWLFDHPPQLVLDGSYCYWDYWGPGPGPAGETRRLVHLDKSSDEVEWRGRAGSPWWLETSSSPPASP